MLLGPGSLRAEEIPSQEPQLRIETGMHTAGIWRLGVSADGKLLVTSSEDKTIRLWSADDGRLLRTFRVPISTGGEGKLYSVAISPDGRFIAAAGWDAYYWKNYWSTYAGHYVHLFDTVSGALVRRIGPVPTVINELEFSRDGTRLAAGLAGAGAGIRVWAEPFDAIPFADMDYKDSVFGLDFSADGALAVASDDGFIRLYDTAYNRLAKTTVPSGPSPRSVAFSPDGERLAVSQVYSVGVDILSGRTLEPIAKVDTTQFNNTNLLASAWSADGATLYLAGGYADKDWDYPIIAWRDGETRIIKDARGPEGGINDLKAMPDGGIAFASHDPSFGIFDAVGNLRLVHNQVTADMRNKYGGYFWNAADATSVWFGLKLGAQDPWLFDVKRLSFAAAPKIPAGYIQPVTNSLPIENWNNAYQPTIDAQVLALGATEMSRSLAIAGDLQSFVIGSDWAIARFAANGSLLWRKFTESFVWGVSLSADGQIAIAALGDGTLRWYRTSDGAELLGFFVNASDHKWIAWTPKGYYAASAGGEDLIGWHFNGKHWDDPPDFFPASRFRDQFYRPDIVQLVLGLKDETAAIETANNIVAQQIQKAGAGEEPVPETGVRDILPAVVEFAEDTLEIETDKPDVQLRYRLRSPSGREITRVEVLIDGRPVTPRSAVAVDEGADAKILALTVPPRDTEVTLIAYIGDQPGVPVTMPIKWKGKIQNENKPRLFALLVGVSGYASNDLKLRYAAKDASDLAVLLQKQEGVFYEKVEIKLLLDEAATEDAIEIELAKLRKKSAPDDNVVVFMAGHGYTDASQSFYFLPTGVDLSPDMLAATAIDGDIIRKGLSKIPGKVILFMDACHAGDGIEGASMVDMNGLANGFSDGAGLVMFASSTGRDVSYEGPQWENGAFTEALMSILSDPGAYGADGKLSISELDEELTTRVEALTGGKQTPVMTKPGAVKRFFVAAL